MDKPPAKALISRFRENYPATHPLFLAFSDCRLEVRTNSARLREDLKNYFGLFLADDKASDILVTAHEAPAPTLDLPFVIKPPDPGKNKIKEEYVDLEGGRIVRKRLTGMVFVFGGGRHVAVGPCLDNVNQIVNFINNRYIEWRLQKGCLLGHAAGVVWKERGLALAGFSGMGKSTLALHLMSRGAVFVSNDRMIVERVGNGLVMHGVAKHPRINPGTALSNADLHNILSEKDKDRFLSLPERELWHLEHKYDALVEECFGPDRFVLSGPMDGLVILNWKRGKQPLSVRRIDPKDHMELVGAFKKKKGLFYLPSDRTKVQDPPLEIYAELLSNCSVIEMSGGADFDGATDVCMHFLETGKVSG
jgi:HprK-related kinase B